MNSNICFNHFVCNNGFLSGYVEVSIEKPEGGLNGNCIVHYGGEHSQCAMRVKLVNGVRDGTAIIVDDGMPYLRLEYKKGLLTGVVERFSEYGLVELHGRLVNGVEEGLFEEYDKDKKLIWNGCYQDGKRYYEVVKKNGDNGNGEYYELDENQEVKRLCLYVNGVRSRVLARFDGGLMTEVNENEKRVYVGEFKGCMKSGFVRDGKGKEYANDGTEVVYSGEWKNGKRHGIGTEFKGFMPLYSGEWKNGKRHGEGKEMDENGDVVRKGWWIDGIGETEITCDSVVITSLLVPNALEIEELRIEKDSYNESNVTELKMSGLVRLKRIVIGDHCFGGTIVFSISNLPILQSIVIGKSSIQNALLFSLTGLID